MQTRTIRLHDRLIDYALTYSARRRTIGLQVGPKGVRVMLPSSHGPKDADRALKARSDWVLKSLKSWDNHKPAPELEGREGEPIGYLGDILILKIDTHDKARTLVEAGWETLNVRIDDRLDPSLQAMTIRKAIQRWRRKEALQIMTPMVEAYAERLGLPAPKVSVRVNRSRWGSCSSDGSIRMNARLIAYPEPLIEYVCAHEACHLIEMNHSKRFYALLDKIMPDHRPRSKRLKALTPVGVEY